MAAYTGPRRPGCLLCPDFLGRTPAADCCKKHVYENLGRTMDCSYSQLLLDIPQRAAEDAAPYHFLTERHVQALWLEQKYFNSLITSEGTPISVLSPGIWNADAGPDFKKAHLVINGKEVRGDVEIHLSEDSWYHHKHHLDERYNNVVLHVSFWKPRNGTPILTKAQIRIAKTSLEPHLTIPQNRIVQLIDLELYPYKTFIGSGQCAQRLFSRMPKKNAESFFEKAAQWRLQQKRTYLKTRIANPGLLFAAGIAMVLGYKSNAEAFLDLYLQMQEHPIANDEERLAVLMGLSGFFQPPFSEKWSSSPYYRSLENIHKEMAQANRPQVKLFIQKSRPFNHPMRRLACLSKLIGDSSLIALFPLMAGHWSMSWQSCKNSREFKQLQNKLKEMLPNYTDDYWNTHYLFERTPKPNFLPLIGNDTKIEILINVFLPLIEEEICSRADRMEWQAFKEFYSTFPASNTSKTKYLVHRFFGSADKRPLLKKASAEQGAYQLHHDFCIHYEASCEGCPFVERYLKLEGGNRLAAGTFQAHA